MALREYRRKRDFARTPEPPGEARGRRPHGKFVVQKHDASRLHYDFRLEHDGVLKSWAVPKGPSLDPAEKRLAVEVEDHPLDYGDFEGTIPEGEYGGGTVLLWDRGTWHPEGDPAAGLRSGRLSFELRGEKLNGSWSLVRMRDKPGASAAKPSWLLFKAKDGAAGGDADILEDRPESVKTGRDLRAIASGDKPKKARTPAKPKSARAGKAVKSAPKTAAEPVVAGVRLSNPDRVLWPEQGITKLDLANYYRQVEEWILPHIARRPLTLVRCPQGRARACFFQKHVGDGMPEQVHGIAITDAGDDESPYIYIQDLPGVVALVQMGTLELHGWGSRNDALEKPDRMVFDLDPDPSVGFESVVETAFLFRQVLGDLGLESWVQTTGGKGLHVVVPLARRQSWDEVKPFARAVATLIADAAPHRYLIKASKAERRGKIFLDWLRNGRGATAIMAYSTRARPGAPVATPLTWDELPGTDPMAMTVATVPRRLDQAKRDPWAGFGTTRQSLRQSARRTLGLD